MKVSVAYQGGGARVIELMAAALACRTAEQAGDFEIARISGASAGAVAAAMHATGCNVQKIIDSAPTLAKEVAKRFPPSRLGRIQIARRLPFGKPIYSETDLRALIVQMLKLGGVDAERPLRDLVRPGIELRILRSDIRFANSPTATETSETRLADALVDSAAIPFVFRMPVTANNPEILDGGLFQNLPARAALDGLAPGHVPLAFSFEREAVPDLRHAKPLSYALAILNSLLSERVEDASSFLKPSNIVTIPNRRGTFDFAAIFGDDLAATFSEDVASIGGAIRRWKHSVERMDGPDWHSNHPSDLADQASRTQEAVTSFYEKVAKGGFHADRIHHEVVYQSFNEEVPDIYRLTVEFDGAKNPGLQFFRFFFYDSESGPLSRPMLEVKGTDGTPRNAMMLPFRVPGTRTRATLVCLDHPLAPGERITVVKTEESYSGMMQYTTEGFGSEQLSLGPGKRADELRITVHFPLHLRPGIMEDASADRHKDAALLQKEKGLQLPSQTTIEDGQRVGSRTVSSVARDIDSAEQRRFVKVVYYKL